MKLLAINTKEAVEEICVPAADSGRELEIKSVTSHFFGIENPLELRLDVGEAVLCIELSRDELQPLFEAVNCLTAFL